MKYLKLFESNDYYEEIQRYDYQNMVSNRIDIDTEAVDIFKNKFYDYMRFPSQEYRRFSDSASVLISDIPAAFGSNQYDVFIELASLKDEWFVIKVKCDWLVNNHKYYRCDQLEGLIKCLDRIEDMLSNMNIINKKR